MTGITAELAKDLKDAGFPQREDNPQGYDTFFKRSDETEEKVYVPSLEELIDALNKPIQLIVMPNGYSTVLSMAGDGIMGQAYNPATVLANLFLTQTEKKKHA